MSMRGELGNLVVGDYVVVYNHPYKYLDIIEKTTPTQFILKSRGRFNRKHGRKVGESSAWSRPSIAAATPDDIEFFKRRDLIEAIKDTSKGRLEQLPTERLQLIADSIYND